MIFELGANNFKFENKFYESLKKISYEIEIPGRCLNS